MRINTNISAITANNQLTKAQRALDRSLTRLSSGYKLNNASDDPAGMAISDKMRAQIKGLNQATLNAQDGISVIQTSEGAINEIQSMLSRMKELSVQAANDVNSDEERDAIQTEVDQLNTEIDRISKDTDFNTKNLIDGNLGRRVYSNTRGVNQLECSDNIESGTYGIKVTQDARQAIVTGGTMAGGTFESGSITMNGYQVDVDSTDTLDSIVTKLMDVADKIGGSVFVTNDTTNTSGTNAETAGYTVAANVTAGTGKLVFMTDGYGTQQSMTVKCSNASLAAALGISAAATDDGIKAEGLDVKAEFATDASGNRVGFADTAKLSTSGTQITVKDLNNKTFTMDVPGNVAKTQFNDSGITAVAKNNTSATIEQEVTDMGTMNIHVGANANQLVEISIPEITAYTLGVDTVNVMTNETASRSIDAIDKATLKLSSIRAKLGSYENRLDHTTSNLGTSNENLTAALSRMIDTDMADEMTQYTQQSVLVQAGTSVLSQANARPETVLQLLQK